MISGGSWMGFGAVDTSPVSTFVEIWFDPWGWVGIVASGIKDLSWCLKFKSLFYNCMYCFAFWSSPRFVRYRRLSILFWMSCISEIGGDTIRVCCLRYRSSSWEILLSTNPLSNLSSPGKTFVRSLHQSGVVGLRSTKRYPYGLSTTSSYSLIN